MFYWKSKIKFVIQVLNLLSNFLFGNASVLKSDFCDQYISLLLLHWKLCHLKLELNLALNISIHNSLLTHLVKTIDLSHKILSLLCISYFPGRSFSSRVPLNWFEKKMFFFTIKYLVSSNSLRYTECLFYVSYHPIYLGSILK